MACGFVPAENASITADFRALAQPSATWLRHELPVHENRTVGRTSAAAIAISPRRLARVRRAARLNRGRQGTKRGGDVIVPSDMQHGRASR